MKHLSSKLWKSITVFPVIALMMNCGAPFAGVASFTVATRDAAKTTKFEKIGPVIEDQDCITNSLLFFSFGNAEPNHEQLVNRMLDSKNADILLDAKLSFSSILIPFFYIKSCAVAKGQPAKVLD